MPSEEQYTNRGLINQISFERAPIRRDGARRCPCLLLLDTSHSMSGEPIRELTAGVRLLHQDLRDDDDARIAVEIAVVTFGPVRIESDFADVDQFRPKEFQAQGDTQRR